MWLFGIKLRYVGRVSKGGKNTEFRVTSMSATYLLLVTLERPGAFVWWLVRTL